MSPADCYTGLPSQHPPERVQDLFRPYFDLLQVPELVHDAAPTAVSLYREAVIREVAPRLPALSPITDDQYRYEILWRKWDLEEMKKKKPQKHRKALQAQAFAVEGAWNC